MPNGDRQSLPFLPLPTPDPAERSRGRGGPSGIKSWGHGKQKERVQRHLQRLQSAFEDRKQELRGELAGVEPELALVIETAGSIDRFHKAVAEIRGLEWLAEYYEPEMAPGDDFYLVSKKKGEEGQKRAFDEPMERLSERRFVVPLLKALLLHGVQWGPSQGMVEELLSTAIDEDRNVDRMTLGRYLGYGFPEEERLAGCHEQRATLYGWGELGDGDGHIYRIPLPLSLSGKKVWRRLTITLAWLTPINPFDQRYRRANLWFEPKNPGKTDSARLLGVMRTEADGRAAIRGTVQHEILEGESAAVFSDEQDLVVKVSCRAHAGKLTESVPYGLAISLEVAPGVELPIYDEVRARLRVKARIRP